MGSKINYRNIKIPKRILDVMLSFEDLDDLNNFIIREENEKYKLKVVLVLSEFQQNPSNICGEFREENFICDMRKDNFFRIMKKETSKDFTEFFFGYYFIESDYFALFFTFLNTSDIEKYFIKFINSRRDLNSFWITHKLTYTLIDYIIKKFNAKIIECRGRYSPGTDSKAKSRPYYRRRLYYKGRDCVDFIDAQKRTDDSEGINADTVESFTAELGRTPCELKFNRKYALFTCKNIKIPLINKIIKWIFDNAQSYIFKIREFKMKLYNSRYIEARTYSISKTLKIEFKEKFEENMLNGMKKLLEDSELEIIDYKYFEDTEEYLPVHDYKFFNRNKKSFFRTILTSDLAIIHHNINSNFLSVIPLLDILDFYQPNYNIAVID